MKALLLIYFLTFQMQLEELPLEELLKINVYALKIPAEIKQVPADVVIIDKSEIESLGFTDLASLISFLAGFYFWTDRSFDDISLRGVPSGIKKKIGTLVSLISELHSLVRTFKVK